MKYPALRLFALAVTALLTLTLTVQGQTTPVLTTLYTFTGPDGADPLSALVQGSDGNFYGTTYGGDYGSGTVFSITPAGTLTVLYSFTDGTDGAEPHAALVQGSDGNFYGTTYTSNNDGGTVFSITPAGAFTTLHDFTGGSTDGSGPEGKLIQGSDGNFYGTTYGGGTSSKGTIFSITSTGVLTTIHSFTGGSTDGGAPQAGLVLGGDGNFYGVTTTGGSGNSGTVFSVTPAGVLTTLYSFGTLDSNNQNTDGAVPYAGLALGSDGNFYGATEVGGTSGQGTIFSITPAGVLTTLYTFTGGADGASPLGTLIQGSDGNFYGTTYFGGGNDQGTIFSITPAGVLTTLHSFIGTDGALVYAGLVQGSDGNFYGATFEGAGNSGKGSIFKLTVAPAPGTVQFASASINTTEGAGSIALTVSRQDGGNGAVSVDYATSDGTAIAGVDYQATSGTLSWADGDTADKTITVPIIDRQAFDDGTVAFNVGLANPTGGVGVGTVPTATVSILDNDTAPQPTIAIASPPDNSTFVAGTTVPFAASVDDPGGLLSTVTFTVNGLPVYQSTGHGPFVKNIDTSAFPPNQYQIVATVTDNQGRTNSSTITATLIAPISGSTPPTAAVLTPLLDASGQPRNLAAGSTVTISFTAASTDGSDLAKVSLYADGLLVAAFDGEGNPITSMGAGRLVRRDTAAGGVGALFQTPYTLPSADKIVNLIAVALDKLGQSTVSTVASIHSTVTTDNAPLVALGGLTSGTHVKVGSITAISVSASDPDAATAILLGQGPGRVDAEGNATLAELEYFINGISQGKSFQPPFSFAFTPPSSGKYVLNAVATDGSGLATISDPITATVDPVASTVNLAAGGSGIAVEGGAAGIVLVTRTGGDTSAALTVDYKVKGTAVAGVDYKRLPGTITIPAGAARAKIKVKPLAGSHDAGVLKLKCVLLPSIDGSYVVGTSPAKIKLVGK